MEDLKLGSMESIPKQFIEKARKYHQYAKKDLDGNYVKDSEGNQVYETNEKEVKKAIKDFATHFADFGIDINEINFDDYLLEGVELDKIPKNCLTIIQIKNSNSSRPQSHFYIFDKRKSQNRENPLLEAGTSTMYSPRKGRYIDVGRIPDYQFLEKAENVWVIPGEVLQRDVSKLRSTRRTNRAETEKFTRYKELPYRYSWGKDPRSLDKSGYIIDPEKIKSKLEKFKKEKALSTVGSYSSWAEKEIKEVVSLYNKMATLILKIANQQLTGGRMEVDLSKLATANRYLNTRIDYLISAANRADGGDPYYFDYRLKDLKNFFEETSEGRDLVNQYDKLLNTEEVESATEGIGCKYNRTLQATEGYFIDKEILSAFEGDEI